MNKKNGFSLIELLVAIGIISIISAMLLPVYSQAMGKSREAVCISNLKQLGMAMHMYINDNNGKFPPTRAFVNDGKPELNWAGCYGIGEKCDPKRGSLYPYVKNAKVFKCPSAQGAYTPRIKTDASPYPLSYSINNMLLGNMMGAVIVPTRVGLLVQQDPSSIDDCDFNWGGWAGHTDDINDGHETPGTIHDGGTCVLYCDLHAKWGRQGDILQDLKDDYWNPAKK